MMARARHRAAWDHTAWLCHVIHNCAFVKTPKTPRDFNPLLQLEPLPKLNPKASIRLLRGTFAKKQPKPKEKGV